jgi:hypothetical protein
MGEGRRTDAPSIDSNENAEKTGMTAQILATRSAFLALVLVATGRAHADDRDADPAQVLAELNYATPYELTLSTPETGETLHREGRGDAFVAWALATCLSADGRGAFRAEVRLPAAGRNLTLRSVGPAEDFYLAYALKLDESFAKWLRKARAAAGDSPDVVIDADERYTERGEGVLDPVPAELLPVVAAAAAKYEEKRPELVLRARRSPHRSRLFFPPAAKAGWSVRREGDRLVVTAACVDRMYVARFDVEYRKAAGGWEYVRLHAREEFKGE